MTEDLKQKAETALHELTVLRDDYDYVHTTDEECKAGVEDRDAAMKLRDDVRLFYRSLEARIAELEKSRIEAFKGGWYEKGLERGQYYDGFCHSEDERLLQIKYQQYLRNLEQPTEKEQE